MAIEIHRARQAARKERVERAIEKAAASGKVREWREARRAPRTLPRSFENQGKWPKLLLDKAL